MFAAGLLALLLALTVGQTLGFSDLRILALFGAAAALLTLFVFVERRVRYPMVDLGMFRNIQFSLNLTTGALTFVAIAAVVFLLPFYLELVLHLPVNRVGILMAIVPIVLSLLGPLSGSLSDRFGTRPVSVVGLVLLMIGYLTASTMNEATTPLGYVLRMLPIGLGMGVFQSPNNSAIMGAAPRNRLGVASGMLSITRTLGQTAGIALLGGALCQPAELLQQPAHRHHRGHAGCDFQRAARPVHSDGGVDRRRLAAVAVGLATRAPQRGPGARRSARRCVILRALPERRVEHGRGQQALQPRIGGVDFVPPGEKRAHSPGQIAVRIAGGRFRCIAQRELALHAPTDGQPGRVASAAVAEPDPPRLAVAAQQVIEQAGQRLGQVIARQNILGRHPGDAVQRLPPDCLRAGQIASLRRADDDMAARVQTPPVQHGQRDALQRLQQLARQIERTA